MGFVCYYCLQTDEKDWPRPGESGPVTCRACGGVIGTVKRKDGKRRLRFGKAGIKRDALEGITHEG